MFRLVLTCAVHKVSAQIKNIHDSGFNQGEVPSARKWRPCLCVYMYFCGHLQSQLVSDGQLRSHH